MDDQDILQSVLLSIGKAIGHVSVSSEDDTAIAALLEPGRVTAGESFISQAVKSGVALTPGFWARYFQVTLAIWDEGGSRHALSLPELREIYSQSDDRSNFEDELLDAAADALQILASAHDDDTDKDLGNQLYALARAAERVGDPDSAYNLAAFGLQLGPPPGPQAKIIAEYALSLAVAADRPHQIAVCSGEIAASVAAIADESAESRLATFTACETAIERLARAPNDIAKLVAIRLLDVLRPRPWLLSLGAPLATIAGDAESRRGLTEILGRERWPERVSVGTLKAWATGIRAWFHAMLWEIEIEKDRLALEPAPKRDAAQADWVSWTVRHPSYARAVPHYRSFLRERDFDRNLLVLTHETTHVLSFVGFVGSALTALRVAALDNELTIWSVTPGVTEEGIQAQVGEHGVAPLANGNAASLFRAEVGVELALKAQALQDTWTPWFEGLAVFSEIAADPALDATGIGPVTEVLRNLVDFEPEAAPEGIFDDVNGVPRQYQAFAAEFEERCSRAIAVAGPNRLFSYLTDLDQPYYLAGYLAVRMVVASWRATTGRALHGAEVLTLLLHATRFGTREAIPDLSLQSDVFATDAVRRMAKWASDLAALPAEMIEDFLAAPSQSDAGGRAYVWRGPALVPVDSADPSLVAEQRAHLLQLVKDAQATLTAPADAERVGDAPPLCKSLVVSCGETAARYNATPAGEANIAKNAELAQHYVNLGSLLPIGRASGKFWLNNDKAAGNSFLMTLLRTAEARAETGEPSLNGFGFPIDPDRSEELAEGYRVTGVPRMQITRLIDLGRFIAAEPGGLHFFAFGYEGGWLWLRGSNQATDKMMKADPERLKWLAGLVQHRLWPSPGMRAEVEVIAQGHAGAARTRDWITANTQWRVEQTNVPVEPWARLVHDRAERALAADVRSQAQREASRQLLDALFRNPILAGKIVSQGLQGLTKNLASERYELAKALLRTALKPALDEWLETHAAALERGGLPIFSKSVLGWDVRPSQAQL
jgi:hypothetical protein